MPRAGELTYYEAIGAANRTHALNKPFSDEQAGPMLMQVGAILALLPPPPARVLECGCGTGWLSQLLQKSGYRVTGTDVSPNAIDLARNSPMFHGVEPPQFVVADAEQLPFDSLFDAVVFFDALHHAVDEQAAINAAHRALKPGGVCIASETGPGHAENSREVVERFDVTEKDMPPRRILQLGRAAGFSKMQVVPRADEIGRRLFSRRAPAQGFVRQLLRVWPLNYIELAVLLLFRKRSYGITLLWK
jgi:SAM-dependent methyltransferase